MNNPFFTETLFIPSLEPQAIHNHNVFCFPQSMCVSIQFKHGPVCYPVSEVLGALEPGCG